MANPRVVLSKTIWSPRKALAVGTGIGGLFVLLLWIPEVFALDDFTGWLGTAVGFYNFSMIILIPISVLLLLFPHVPKPTTGLLVTVYRCTPCDVLSVR